MASEDDFYIGYRSHAPKPVARWLRWSVFILLLLSFALAGLLATNQQPFAPAKFEFGQYRELQGILLQDPYPRLLVERPGQQEGHSLYSSYLLVSPFKFGADAEISGFIGKSVSLKGTLIYRDDQTMLEIVPGSIEMASAHTDVIGEQAQSLGLVTLTGEIVDSKCFTGVMKPGHLKSHRACAIRCISGGIPPVLVVNARAENTRYFLLVDSAGKAVNKLILDKLAVPVQITGELLRYGDLMVLKADPQHYVRI